MRIVRASALLPLLALLVPAGSVAEQTPSVEWRRAVKALLEERARAVTNGDTAAFAATMAAAPRAFRSEKMRWLGRMRSLPIGTYELGFARDGFDDLSSALDRRPAGDEVRVVHATELVAFAGYDEEPAAEDLYLTAVRRGERWSIVSDDDLDDLGLRSSRNLWDFGRVDHVERAGVMVLHRGELSTARRILDATVAAVARVEASWPLKWRARVVVAIPRTTDELERILQTTFDLGPFVAFATSSLDRPKGEWVLSGHRVYVQPATFFRASIAFQEDILGHELLHIASRSNSGASTPSWLEEGVAQIYGERAQPGFGALGARVRRGAFGGRLPEDHRFSLGSPDDIRTSYEASAHFTRYLNGRFGRRAGARLYRVLGAEKPVGFGTWRYHLDRAAREAFSRSFRTLERAWEGRLEEEFGG